MMSMLSAPLSSLEYEEAVLMAAQDVGGVPPALALAPAPAPAPATAGEA